MAALTPCPLPSLPNNFKAIYLAACLYANNLAATSSSFFSFSISSSVFSSSSTAESEELLSVSGVVSFKVLAVRGSVSTVRLVYYI